MTTRLVVAIFVLALTACSIVPSGGQETCDQFMRLIGKEEPGVKASEENQFMRDMYDGSRDAEVEISDGVADLWAMYQVGNFGFLGERALPIIEQISQACARHGYL